MFSTECLVLLTYSFNHWVLHIFIPRQLFLSLKKHMKAFHLQLRCVFLFGYLVLHYHFIFNQFSVWAAKGVIWFWGMHTETAILNSPQASFIWSYSKRKFAEMLSYWGWTLLYIFHLWLIWLSIRFNEACRQSTLNHAVMCTIDITFCSLHVSSPLLRCGATMLFRNVPFPNLYDIILSERDGD